MVLMPITTVGMNDLPTKLIVHGTAVNNTLRQIFSSIGSAIMMSVLANTTSQYWLQHSAPAKGSQQFAHFTQLANLSGYQAAFMVATAMSAIGILLALFIKRQQQD